jgi:hypothetical protein
MVSIASKIKNDIILVFKPFRNSGEQIRTDKYGLYRWFANGRINVTITDELLFTGALNTHWRRIR